MINMMLYIPNIDDYLKVVTDEEVKDFAAINFRDYFKSLSEEPNLRKTAKWLHIFLITPDEVEKYVHQFLLISVYITIMLRF